MSPVRAFSLVAGVVYLLIGVLGLSPLALWPGVPAEMGPFEGYLFDVLAVNWLLSLGYVLIGVCGLAAYRSFRATGAYTLAVGAVCSGLFLAGAFSPEAEALGGWIPLEAAANVLHLLTALLALLLYCTATLQRDRSPAARARP
ncbi:MAG: DUF4383 domain-containing protein [Rubrobacter sp.]|nr:DUF4383 domain-containing protein [Rubrobacter sp.]